MNDTDTNRTRILIADDHALVRMGPSTLLSTQPDMEVVAAAEDGESAVRMAHELRPDVIIMDYMMPALDGAAATERILKDLPQAKIIILTSYITAEGIARAIDAGAAGALMKNGETETLIQAIRDVRNGKKAIPPEIAGILSECNGIQRLTERQELVLDLITRGLSNHDIARHLNIQEDSVKKQASAIFEKIGASNRAEAVAIALRKHLLKI